MNKYTYIFVSHCPNNDRAITYRLKIKTNQVIMVEDIIAACAEHPRGFHEAIADDLHRRFSGKQKLKAYHHGVKIRTKRK